MVALGQARASDVQLAGRTLRHQRQVGVENVSYPRPDDAADRHAGGALLQLCRCQACQRHHHGFGRAVGVEEQHRLESCTDTLQVFAGQGLTASDAHAYRQGLFLGRQPLRQLTAIAWGETKDVDLLLADQFADFLGIPLPLGAQHHASAAEQRYQQTLGGGVEVDRIEMQFTIIRAHVKAFDHRLAVHGDFPVGHHHALGLAGGARGVDQVRLVLRQVDLRWRAGRVAGQCRAILIQAPARHTRW
ncbi:hypothetical protein D9M71_407250 [compost metagenome]